MSTAVSTSPLRLLGEGPVFRLTLRPPWDGSAADFLEHLNERYEVDWDYPLEDFDEDGSMYVYYEAFEKEVHA